MTYIRRGCRFEGERDFCRACLDLPIELSPQESAPSGHVIGYVVGDPDHLLRFMRSPHVRVRVRVDYVAEA